MIKSRVYIKPIITGEEPVSIPHVKGNSRNRQETQKNTGCCMKWCWFLSPYLIKTPVKPGLLYPLISVVCEMQWGQKHFLNGHFSFKYLWDYYLWLIKKSTLYNSQCFSVNLLISPNIQNYKIISVALTSGHPWTSPLLKAWLSSYIRLLRASLAQFWKSPRKAAAQPSGPLFQYLTMYFVENFSLIWNRNFFCDHFCPLPPVLS